MGIFLVSLGIVRRKATTDFYRSRIYQSGIYYGPNKAPITPTLVFLRDFIQTLGQAAPGFLQGSPPFPGRTGLVQNAPVSMTHELRTVLTFVSAHTSCPSRRKTCFKRALRLTMTQSTMLGTNENKIVLL